MSVVTAVMAEDEPLLALGLRQELSRIWPELSVQAVVADGRSALDAAMHHKPDVMFLDIRMPGMGGLDVAQALHAQWPAGAKSPPLIVFVTAHDEHALAAFELAALDYILKPIDSERLQRTCMRLRQMLARQSEATDLDMEEVVTRLRQHLHERSTVGDLSSPSAELQFLQASRGNTIQMVRVADVLYFEAADKYVRVVTGSDEHLVRMTIKELTARLSPSHFWQVHRGTVVRADAIDAAIRDEQGRWTLTLRARSDRLAVGRAYAARFRGQ